MLYILVNSILNMVYMVTKVIPVRVNEEVLKKIDELVRLGIFSSRNEAINVLLKQGLSEVSLWEELVKEVKELLNSEKELRKKGALAEFLSERDRF